MTLLAVAPALPLHTAGKYVAGAYVVFVVVILIYVTIMAIRLGRMERQLVELNRDVALRDQAGADDHEPDGDRAEDGGRERARVSAGRPGDSPL